MHNLWYNKLPKAGTCVVEPTTGYSLITDYSVVCQAFISSDESRLVYSMYVTTQEDDLKHGKRKVFRNKLNNPNINVDMLELIVSNALFKLPSNL